MTSAGERRGRGDPIDGSWAAHDESNGDVDDDDGEWLSGLRRAGLPVVTGAARREPSEGPLTPPAQLDASSQTPSTRAAYEASWIRFALWCDVRGLDDPYTATPTAVADWIASHVDKGLSASYLRRQLAGVADGFARAGLASPTADPFVRRAVAGVERQLGTTQRRAAPLRLDELRRIVTSIWAIDGRSHAHPTIRRDRALLLLGWAGALRASELVALDVADIRLVDGRDDAPGGCVVTIARATDDRTGGGTHVEVPAATHTATCPVRAVAVLVRQVRVGPLFRRINRHDHIGGRLAATSVTAVVKRRVEQVLPEHDPAAFSSHSLRAGFVTEMRARGVPDHLIARHTRHRDLRMLQTYDRPTDLRADPAPSGPWW